MTNKQLLQKDYPDLVKEYSEMNKDQLLEQICAEVRDLHNMENRVALFMSLCTDNMSKTNYTLDAIKQLVEDKEQKDIVSFCQDLIEDTAGDAELVDRVYETLD